jgi:hypothetical protein
MCCYDKMLVNVAVYVIPGYVCVCVCVCARGVNRNYICSHVYQHFTITTHYCIVFYHFSNS